MESIKQNFEKELKQKLSQKSTSKMSEESFLIKQFKFFDLDNSGDVSKVEFIKTLEKLGITLSEPETATTLFNIYDTDKDGSIDYKEFVSIILSNERNSILPPPVKNNDKMQMKNQNVEPIEQTKDNIQKLKKKVFERGGSSGLMVLGHLFKIIDDNNSKSIDLSEFTKAIREYNLDLHPNDIKSIFNYFDRDRDNSINYEEFIFSLRGGLNASRKAIVLKAYDKLDKDRSGVITTQDLEGVYDAKKHPDVLSGKKSPQDIFLDFLQTFESYSDLKNIRDGQVTKEEFLDYYSYISASIDSDNYFETMISNAWKLNEVPSYVGQKAWAGEIKFNDKADNNNFSSQNYNKAPSLNESHSKRFESSSIYGGDNDISPKQMELIIQRVKHRLASKGPKGFLGFARQFKLMDLDNDQRISTTEFKKAIRDYRIEVTDYEIDALFKMFDRDSNQLIDYDEFLIFLQGDMNVERIKLVNQVFDKIDSNRDNYITINEIKNSFYPRNHPDVKTGRKGEEEILAELLDTLEVYQILNGNFGEEKLSRQDFLTYFRNYSASIPDDLLFETILMNCFKLINETGLAQAYAGMAAGRKDFDPNHKQSYLQDHHKHLIYGGSVSSNAPFGTFNEPIQYNKGQSESLQNKNEINKNELKKFNQGNCSELVKNFRSKLKMRGVNGILSLQRSFRIMDDNNNKLLEFPEFSKALNEMRLDLSITDAKRLFEMFDTNRDASINYDEFLRGVMGEMNDFRSKIVRKAFDKLDKNKNEIIELDDIKEIYNAKNHPDVKSGKKNEDQILGEFIDTFEIHLSILKRDENLRNKKVDWNEFQEYYNNISACIDNDEYFELMIKNCWNLDNVSYQKGWKNEFIEPPKNNKRKF